MQISVGERIYDLRNITKIGRSDKCDIWIDLPAVSLHHATIRLLHGNYFVEDSSRNGTFVNGRRVEQGESVKISPGDILRFNGSAEAIVTAIHYGETIVETTYPGLDFLQEQVAISGNRMLIVEKEISKLEECIRNMEESVRSLNMRQTQDESIREISNKEIDNLRQASIALREQSKNNSQSTIELRKAFVYSIGLFMFLLLSIGVFSVSHKRTSENLVQEVIESITENASSYGAGTILLTSLGWLAKYISSTITVLDNKLEEQAKKDESADG